MTASGIPLGLTGFSSAVGNWALGVQPLAPYMTFNFGV